MAAKTSELATFARLGPGARLGRFTIRRSAGVGGMAAVWCADADGERVALKTILPTFSKSPAEEREHARMFREEGAIASRIEHPNLCRVLEVGESEGVRFLAMEWIDGGSLASLLGVPVPVPIAIRIAADVARGLHAAHGAGIIHRDVSPHNILVARSGRACISDFGVAKVARDGTSGTASGFVKGKVRYMAPEQAYAEPVDARTDVFALGIVLLEAVTGKNPLAAETDVATLTKLASSEQIPVTDVPEPLAAVVARAVDKTPENRFASMADFADALDALAMPKADVGAWLTERLPNEAIAESAAPARAEKRRVLPFAFASIVVAAVIGVAARSSHSAPKVEASSPAPPAITSEGVAVPPAAIPADPPVVTAEAVASAAPAPPATVAQKAPGTPAAARHEPAKPQAPLAKENAPPAPSARRDPLRTRD